MLPVIPAMELQSPESQLASLLLQGCACGAHGTRPSITHRDFGKTVPAVTFSIAGAVRYSAYLHVAWQA